MPKKKRQLLAMQTIRRHLAVTAKFPTRSASSGKLSFSDNHMGYLLRALDDSIYQNLNKLRFCMTESLSSRKFSPPAWEKFFGRNWEGHPFAHETFCWWNDLYERDITGLLWHFINSDRFGVVALRRARSFVAAVHESVFPEEVNCIPLPSSTKSMIVQREADASGGQVDVLLIWENSENPGKRYALVIEAKFGASLKNDLNHYRQSVENKYAGLEEILSVVVAPEGRIRTLSKDMKQAKDWHLTSWFDVLRRWENLLAGDGEYCPDFSRFRASLWRKSFGAKNGQ